MPEADESFDFSKAPTIPTSVASPVLFTKPTAFTTPRQQKPSIAVALDPNGPRTSSTPPASLALPPAPVVDAHGRTLNPRSCVTCRKRKVKCDKLHPCSNCSRAHIDCIFPTPGRAPRKVKKITDGRDTELLARLRRLEGVVKGLGVDVGPASSIADFPAAAPTDSANDEGHSVNYLADNGTSYSFHDRERWTADDKSSGFENRFGRLVVNEGRSRYVNNSFWANLSNEVEDLKGILNEESDDDAEQTSPTSQFHPAGHHHGWIFSFSSQNVDLLALHPIPTQIEAYWNIYKEQVDPLVKVLHIPSIEPTILASASHLANLAKGFECLLFTIYYGAATSLSPEECLAKLGEERGVLLSRYRFAIEQALARANFLTTEEIVVLQAFSIFLICLRRNNDARVIWTLTGLIVRMAQTIGIHRDGSHFGLAPFEIEMRRRLWWQVCILDVRASEDHGCDPTIIEQSFDTKMPLNVNDVDLDPGMKELPREKQGCTDMTFCLIRFEVANTFRRLNYVPPGPLRYNEQFSATTLQEKERWITECHQRLEEKYLKRVDMSVPIFWVTATVARLMMSKMWLMVYHPFQRQNGGASLPEEIKDKLFITSLENIEYSILLQTEARTMKWGWLFRTYMQWHALAFILSELCHRTRGELVERAWKAVEKTRDGRWNEISDEGRNGHLWKPLMRLMTKASAAHQKALREDGLARQQGTTSPGMLPPGSTVELLEAMRNRPTIVRAPLSHAQLARFMAQPPRYGSEPIDTTKLLQSPVLDRTLVADDPMDVTVLPEPVQETFPQYPQVQQSRSANPQNPMYQHHASRSQTWPRNPLSINGRTPSTAGLADQGFNEHSVPSSTNPHVAHAADGQSIGISPFENGELDWANWDQLVRQFGMDVDQTSGSSGQAANWAGPNWTNYGNNGGMGGMGPTDWF